MVTGTVVSKSARKRANQQAANYWQAVFEALESDDETHVDPSVRVLACPECGTVLLGFCEHDRRRDALAP